MKKSYDVVVVGAGFAGLTAAYELRDKDVLVLEAAPAVSSRSRRDELDGQRITVGGEDWAGLDPASPERKIVSDLGVAMEPMKGTGGVMWGDRMIRAASRDELVDQLPIDASARNELAETYDRINETARRLGDPGSGPALARDLMRVSASEWLGQRHADIRTYYQGLFGCEFSLRLEEVSALFFNHFLPPYGGGGFDGWSSYETPAGGMPDVVDALVASLPHAPVTDALVTSVANDGTGAVVTFLHGGAVRQVRCARVVVATPAWVTQGIVEGLPDWKSAALRTVRPEPSIEVNLVIDDGGAMPWDDLMCGWGIDSAVGMYLPSQTDRALRVAGDLSKKKSVINLVSLGARAEPWIECTDDQVAQAFAQDFCRVYPEAQGRVTAHHVQKWAMGVCYPRLGYEKHVPALLKSWGNVHFAGDWAGFASDDETGGLGVGVTDYTVMIGIHVAMRSGIRAAREICALLD